MDFYKKIKQKIAEELDDDDEEIAVDESARQDHPESVGQLHEEIRVLKNHLNTNYNVYVKRLDKRKCRIKELEEYTKLIIKDNESLTDQLQKAEGYKSKLVETRENLEQMEGYQNQELSKIKHMLLSAETALEHEKTRRSKALDDLEELQQQYNHLLNASTDIPLKKDIEIQTEDIMRERQTELIAKIKMDHVQTVEALKEQIQDLEGQLLGVEDGKDASVEGNKDVELRSRLKQCQGERDAAKASLIEVEISKHEIEEKLTQIESEFRMKINQLSTEKETLEVTLNLRDSELKNRMEDARQEREKFARELKSQTDLSDAKSAQLSALLAENTSFKSNLSESHSEFRQLSSQHESLIQQCAILTEQGNAKDEEIDLKESEIKQVQERLENLHRDFEDMVSLNHQLEGSMCEIKDDSTKLQQDLEDVKKELETVQDATEKLEAERTDLTHQLEDSEKQFPERLENSNLVKDLRDSNQTLNDELADKKQSAKLLQQRLNDMKKMFQKELKSAHEDSEPPVVSNGGPSSSLRGSPKPFDTTSDSADLAYLKHVIFKFLTSREYEAKQLTRAVATLLHFSREEERLLREHLEWKSSWFGSKPNLGTGQFALSIDPS